MEPANQNVEDQKKTKAEKMEELRKMLQQRYPYQGFGASPLSEDLEQNITTWTQVLHLAERGLFDRIRPDILVNNYGNLVAIRDAFIESSVNSVTEEEIDKKIEWIYQLVKF